ncbi:hypothetical protein GPECTOR_64g97 [Gonium pectorale]|uniref:Septin-type G domain-containing protein n=1 Tax=Gonium pectorale TaxID=33097 RepID=A0A150G493_GONPE|nr:hypothetical protein GPECTOR_64g97 [Gonium pectorale]|eukprot:KXZ44677.1 hypothetical protein GPECTOR_64g97 [Gonium pectorale]
MQLPGAEDGLGPMLDPEAPDRRSASPLVEADQQIDSLLPPPSTASSNGGAVEGEEYANAILGESFNSASVPLPPAADPPPSPAAAEGLAGETGAAGSSLDAAVDGEFAHLPTETQSWSRAGRPPHDHARVLLGPSGASLARRGPLVPSRPSPLHLNVLVAGGSFLGKSTLVHNLALHLGAHPDELGQPREPGSPLSSFASAPESLATRLPSIPLPGTGRTLVAAIQDTPGTGADRDLVGHLRCMVRWLLSQRQRDYEWAHGASGLAGECLGALPHGATICLFMVQPHGLSGCELAYLSALSRLVAVVPLIAKADAHTEQELRELRGRLEQAMGARKDGEGRVAPFRFSPAALEAVQMPPGSSVFSVLASRTLDELVLPDGGRVWVPVREYGWGSVSSADPAASDALALKRLLTEDVWALLEDARDRYSSFCSAYEAAGRDIEPLLERIVGDFSRELLGEEAGDPAAGAAVAGAAAASPPHRVEAHRAEHERLQQALAALKAVMAATSTDLEPPGVGGSAPVPQRSEPMAVAPGAAAAAGPAVTNESSTPGSAAAAAGGVSGAEAGSGTAHLPAPVDAGKAAGTASSTPGAPPDPLGAGCRPANRGVAREQDKTKGTKVASRRPGPCTSLSLSSAAVRSSAAATTSSAMGAGAFVAAARLPPSLFGPPPNPTAPAAIGGPAVLQQSPAPGRAPREMCPPGLLSFSRG